MLAASALTGEAMVTAEPAYAQVNAAKPIALPSDQVGDVATNMRVRDLWDLCLDGDETTARNTSAFSCRRNGVGWSDVRLNRIALIRPTHWRLWDHKRA